MKRKLIFRCVVYLLVFTCPVMTSAQNVTDVLLDDTSCRGAHITTRPHNRKVLYDNSSQAWYVFNGTGHWLENGDENEMLRNEQIGWRTSRDGVTFGPFTPVAWGNGHSSSVDVILGDGRIYLAEARFGYWREKEGIPYSLDGKLPWHPDRKNPDGPNNYSPYEVFALDILPQGPMTSEIATALPGDSHVGHAGPHYGSLGRDTDGHLWTAARAMSPDGLSVWVARSTLPDDISAWDPHTVLIRDRQGTLAPQIIGLSGGQVGCVVFSKGDEGTLFFHHSPDTHRWGDPIRIGEGRASKRTSAVFDPESGRLHVVYTDSDGSARHRWAASPYGRDEWTPPVTEPGMLVTTGVGMTNGDDDLTLSINSSISPAPLALVRRGPDQMLYLHYFDGVRWMPEGVAVGSRDEALACDEASAVADFAHGLGFVYWCQWRDPDVRKEHDNIGVLRFCHIRDVAALFGPGH
jgi:hypothetical protein